MIMRAASPIAWLPVAQAVTTEWLGPRKPYLIETWPETRLIRQDGTKNGLTAARALFLQDHRGLVDAVEAADAGADEDAGAVELFLVGRRPAGIGHGFRAPRRSPMTMNGSIFFWSLVETYSSGL